MSRGFYCNVCKKEFDMLERGNCPECGYSDVSVHLTFSDNFSVKEQIRGKAKVPEQKKPTKEFKCGDDFYRKEKKFVERTMIVDRENDTYDEKIVDRETGEVLHECHETLKDHFGHGSAKETANKGSTEK